LVILPVILKYRSEKSAPQLKRSFKARIRFVKAKVNAVKVADGFELLFNWRKGELEASNVLPEKVLNQGFHLSADLICIQYAHRFESLVFGDISEGYTKATQE